MVEAITVLQGYGRTNVVILWEKWLDTEGDQVEKYHRYVFYRPSNIVKVQSIDFVRNVSSITFRICFTMIFPSKACDIIDPDYYYYYYYYYCSSS